MKTKEVFKLDDIIEVFAQLAVTNPNNHSQIVLTWLCQYLSDSLALLNSRNLESNIQLILTQQQKSPQYRQIHCKNFGKEFSYQLSYV